VDDDYTDEELTTEEFKKGDIVYFYSRPGELTKGVVQDIAYVAKIGESAYCYCIKTYCVSGSDRLLSEGELYESALAATEDISPDGKRMRACLVEALGIYLSVLGEEEEPPASEAPGDLLDTISIEKPRMIVDIALELFRTES
jgi:hypothetical protein